MIRILSIALTALLAQAPQTQQSAPAMVVGQVVQADTRGPLAGVTVELVRAQGPGAGSVQPPINPALPPPAGGTPAAPLTFKTGPDGRFRIPNVPAGEYRLYGTHVNAYTPAEYGQRSPSGLGMPLVLAAGQNKAGIVLTMARTASISGRVTDGNREPAAFVSMLAFRIVYRQGVRTVEVVQSVLTDDRGEYRLFWLVPGKYYLSALPIQARQYALPLSFPSRVGGAVYLGTPVIALRASEAGEIFEETYLPIYYPGALDIRAAKPIVLKAGENLKADFNVGPSQTRTLEVRGFVTDAAGQPLPSARVSLAPRKTEGHSTVLPAATADPKGAFSIHGVVPGSYFLYVTGISAPFSAAPGVNVSSVPLTATVPLDVGTSDILNLKVQVAPGADIPWKLAYEPRAGADPSMPALRVSLRWDPDLAGALPISPALGGGAKIPPGQPPPPAQVLQGVGSGSYRVTVGPLPATGYVKSIRLGTTDVLRDGLHVSGPVRDELQIVVSANAGAVDGLVLDRTRQPFSNATIALLPEISQRAGRLDLFKNTTTNEEGKFRIEGVAPGEYRIFAWEDVPSGEWYDPDFMLKYEILGTVVQVDEVKAKTIEIGVIPAERSEP